MRVGLVAIGRNEGDRLKRCLRSMPEGCPVVYVDSGSTDGSVEFAEGLGVSVERLSAERGFTAARARNAGWRRLMVEHPDLDFIQFIDGDCELDPQWVEKGVAALDAEPTLCVAFGRVRERFPQASIYNQLCDDEWNVPVGLTDSCGGIALFRVRAIVGANGFSDDLIAGEEPDLCLRLRLAGWFVRRIPDEMTWHDADIHRFSQWWRRVRRSGHAYAEHVMRHGANAIPTWRRQCRSIIFWGALIPATIVLFGIVGLATGIWAASLCVLTLLALYPAQMFRIAVGKWRQGATLRFAAIYGTGIMLGKFAQFGGLARYLVDNWRGAQHQLIEYKNRTARDR